MDDQLTDLGNVMFTRKGTKESFMEIISKLDIKFPVVVKPNWSDSIVFTEKEILDWTLSALDGEVVVVESYAFYRSRMLVEYDRLLDSKIEQKLVSQKKSDFTHNDKWFMEYSGIGDVLKRHDVEYINISEEVWANRVCEQEQVRKETETLFEPVENNILYGVVPTRIYNMRGGTLLSIAKPKIAYEPVGVSLSLKNMFGLIPGPKRGKFHGPRDAKLNQSIVDINKIYRALFEVKGIVEAVFSTFESRKKAQPMIHRDLGFIWGSNDTLELDALVATQIGRSPEDIGHLSLAAKNFGSWSSKITQIAKQYPISLG